MSTQPMVTQGADGARAKQSIVADHAKSWRLYNYRIKLLNMQFDEESWL